MMNVEQSVKQELARETEVMRKPAPVPFCSPQISSKFFRKFRKSNIHNSVKDFAVIRLSERVEAVFLMMQSTSQWHSLQARVIVLLTAS
jgi:hypothetical protein